GRRARLFPSGAKQTCAGQVRVVRTSLARLNVATVFLLRRSWTVTVSVCQVSRRNPSENMIDAVATSLPSRLRAPGIQPEVGSPMGFFFRASSSRSSQLSVSLFQKAQV